MAVHKVQIGGEIVFGLESYPTRYKLVGIVTGFHAEPEQEEMRVELPVR